MATVYGNSWQKKRPSTFLPWLQPLEITRVFNKLPYLVSIAHVMGTQAHHGGHMIGTHDQLKGISVNILCSHTYPVHLVHMCIPTQAPHMLKDGQVHTGAQTCCSMLRLYPIFLHVYLCCFFIFSCLFLTISKAIFSSFICLSPSLCSQPQFWFSVSFYQPSAALYGRAGEVGSMLVTPACQHHDMGLAPSIGGKADTAPLPLTEEVWLWWGVHSVVKIRTRETHCHKLTEHRPCCLRMRPRTLPQNIYFPIPHSLGRGWWPTPARDSCVSSPRVTRGSTSGLTWRNGWGSGYEHFKPKEEVSQWMG